MSQKVRRATDVHSAPLDDTVLVLNAATGRYHGLDPVGARIWHLLAEPRGEDELTAILVAEYEVTAEVCRPAVAAFLDGLRTRGLLVDA